MSEIIVIDNGQYVPSEVTPFQAKWPCPMQVCWIRWRR